MSESLAWFHKASSLHELLPEFPTISMDLYQCPSFSTNAFGSGCFGWETSPICACAWRLGAQLMRFPKRDWLRVLIPPTFLQDNPGAFVHRHREKWLLGVWITWPQDLALKPCKAAPTVGGWTTLLHFPSLFLLFRVSPKPLPALFSSSVCCWRASPRRAGLLSRETSHAMTMRLWHMTISFYFSELHPVRNYKPPLSIIAVHEPETCTSI